MPIKIIRYYDDCRDKCKFYELYNCCSMSCYPFNIKPLHKAFLRQLLASNKRLIKDYGIEALLKSKA